MGTEERDNNLREEPLEGPEAEVPSQAMHQDVVAPIAAAKATSRPYPALLRCPETSAHGLANRDKGKDEGPTKGQ